MEQNTNKNEKIPSKFLSTQFVLMIRVMAGVYLVYVAYSLIDVVVNGTGREKYFLGIFMIAFAVIGILLMFYAGRDLLRGKYIGGEMDAGDEEDDELIDAEAEVKTDTDEEENV